MDSQTVHASVSAPADTTGLDAGKKSRGRKRGTASDVLGLVIAVVVAAAGVHDNVIGIELWTRWPSTTQACGGRGWKVSLDSCRPTTTRRGAT